MTINPVTTQQQHDDFEHRSSLYKGTSCNVEQSVNKEFKWLHLFSIEIEIDLRKLNSQVNLNPSEELFMYHSDSSIIN